MDEFNKIGRNDWCSCGSGKKYKKCCLSKALSKEVMDFSWRQLRHTEGEIIGRHLLPYIQDTAEGLMLEVWEDFALEAKWPEEASQLLFNHMFIPWFLFNWVPDEEWVVPQHLMHQPLALSYLKNSKKRLSDYQKRFIETLCQSYYSFYVVIEVVPKQSLKLRDILLQMEHQVKEREGTHYLQRGDIIFTRILSLDEQSICIGMPPYSIPSSYHTQLLDYRQTLEEENEGPLTAQVLRTTYEWELRTIYFDIISEQFDQPIPQVCNTDGEPFQFCKVHCTLQIEPQEAFERLLPLTLSDGPESFLSEAKRDKQGKIISIEFPWLKKGNQKHADWENTVLGHVVIRRQELIVEVNSEMRAKKVLSLLQQYLKADLSSAKTLIESMEQKLKSKPKNSSQNKLEDLNALAEVQDYLKEMGKKHWEQWLDEPIPALQGKTPREASKTPAGRELLEALLLSFERNNENHPDNPSNPDIDALRAELA